MNKEKRSWWNSFFKREPSKPDPRDLKIKNLERRDKTLRKAFAALAEEQETLQLSVSEVLERQKTLERLHVEAIERLQKQDTKIDSMEGFIHKVENIIKTSTGKTDD